MSHLRHTSHFLDATTTWLIKRTTGLVIHYIYTLPPQSDASPCHRQTHSLSDRPRLVTLRTQADLEALPPNHLKHIGDHTSQNPSRIIDNGGRIYALAIEKETLSQVNALHGIFNVSTPLPMRFELKPQTFFLGFLYTPFNKRGKGYAHELLTQTCNALRDEGFTRGLCHIRPTNLASR